VHIGIDLLMLLLLLQLDETLHSGQLKLCQEKRSEATRLNNDCFSHFHEHNEKKRSDCSRCSCNTVALGRIIFKQLYDRMEEHFCTTFAHRHQAAAWKKNNNNDIAEIEIS
jgi:hypothetical protein